MSFIISSIIIWHVYVLPGSMLTALCVTLLNLVTILDSEYY